MIAPSRDRDRGDIEVTLVFNTAAAIFTPEMSVASLKAISERNNRQKFVNGEINTK